VGWGRRGGFPNSSSTSIPPTQTERDRDREGERDRGRLGPVLGTEVKRSMVRPHLPGAEAFGPVPSPASAIGPISSVLPSALASVIMYLPLGGFPGISPTSPFWWGSDWDHKLWTGLGLNN
jgi:hypothetical protein